MKRKSINRLVNYNLISTFNFKTNLRNLAQCQLAGGDLNTKVVNHRGTIDKSEGFYVDHFEMIGNPEGFFVDRSSMIDSREAFFVDHFPMIDNRDVIFVNHFRMIDIKLAGIIAFEVALWFHFEINKSGFRGIEKLEELYIH